jgi:hypothetical protein
MAHPVVTPVHDVDGDVPQPGDMGEDIVVVAVGGSIDFESIARRALARARELVERWLPGGHYEGEEYLALNPKRLDHGKHSFKVNTATGAWSDFATGDKGGDLISFYGFLNDLKNGEAARMLDEMLGGGALNGVAQAARGLTLAQYSAAKMIPIYVLQGYGLRDQARYGKHHAPAVAMPYFRADGGEPSIKYRVSLSGGTKTLWRKGDRTLLYGEHWAQFLPQGPGYAIIVEGESDCHTLWYHDFPAFGLPGAGGWKDKRDAHLFDGIPVIYVVVEPDAGGKAVLSWLARSSIGPRAKLVRMPAEIKDPSALYLADTIDFKATFQRMLDAAEPLREATASETTVTEGEGVTLDDFYAYMPQHSYIYTPAHELWPQSSVNSRIPPIPVEADQEIPANWWLDQNKPVEQMTWAPGLPMIIDNRLIFEGGWIERKKVSCFNLYLPPNIKLGDATKASRWLDHVNRVYPNDADHILRYLAHRVQRPAEKINHALVLGGKQGIGKDTLIEPAKRAVGPWNFKEISPKQLVGRFNGFLKSVILRINEAHDLGDEITRYGFYEHTKVITASPPDVLRIDEKNLREHQILNCCGVIMTTNHKTDGIYLPSDDRRHYVAWSDLDNEEFSKTYWSDFWEWYNGDGFENIAAYLSEFDLSDFDAKAPPPKTQAFWEIVDSSRNPADAELSDVLDLIAQVGEGYTCATKEWPPVITLEKLANNARHPFNEWLRDRKNARSIPHRLEACGYVAVRNDAAKDGRWAVGGRRQVIYAATGLPQSERIRLAGNYADAGGR